MQNIYRSLTSTVTALALVLGQVPLAHARLGASTASRPAPAATPSTSPGRLGGASNMGMQRSTVMQTARAQPAPAPAPVRPPVSAPPRPAPVPNQTVANAAPTQVAPAPSAGNNWKPALAGAAAGAALTYAMTRNSNPQPQQPGYQGYPNGQGYSNPGYAAQGPAPAQAPVQAPAYANGENGAGYGYREGVPNSQLRAPIPTAAPVNTGMGFFGKLLVLMLCAGAGLFLWRKFSGTARLQEFRAKATAPVTAAGPAVVPTPAGLMPEVLFHVLQQFNNEGNLASLRKATTPDMFAVLEPTIGSSRTNVESLASTVIDVAHDMDETIASVRFTGTVLEGDSTIPSNLDEVWHFVCKHGTDHWMLAGIEQV